jgi:hypothetical protein
MILKEMLRYEQLAQVLLHSEQYVRLSSTQPVIRAQATTCETETYPRRPPPLRFYSFPTYIESTTFGISCDAFGNLKETLTKHKPMVATYLDANYDRVRPPRSATGHHRVRADASGPRLSVRSSLRRTRRSSSRPTTSPSANRSSCSARSSSTGQTTRS